MIDAYPQALEWNGFKNAHLARTVDAALKITTRVRNMRASYELGKDARPGVAVYVPVGAVTSEEGDVTSEEGSVTAEELAQLADVISCLGRCGPVSFVDQDIGKYPLLL
jgi:hypothetical protein